MRGIDRAVGVPALGILSAFRRGRPAADYRRMLVIKLFGLGNIVMLAPAVQALKSAFPRMEAELLTFAPNAGGAALYRRLFTRAHLLRYSAAMLPLDLGAFLLRRRGAYDLIFDAEQFIRLASMIALALGPRVTAGLPTPLCSKQRAYTVQVPYREDRPLAREYLDLALAVARASGRTAEVPSSLVPPDADVAAAARAEELLRTLPAGARRIVVCVGGRPDALIKRYPRDSWSALLRRLLEAEPGVHLLFTGTRDEASEVAAVTAGLPRSLDLSGKLSVPDLVEVLRRADAVLSNDTGTIHLAAAAGTRVVGFYGPTDPGVYGPFTPDRLILRDPRNVTQISNREEKRHEGSPVYWPSPGDAFEKIRPFIAARS